MSELYIRINIINAMDKPDLAQQLSTETFVIPSFNAECHDHSKLQLYLMLNLEKNPTQLYFTERLFTFINLVEIT